MRRIVAGMVQANTELARTVRELEAPRATTTEPLESPQEDETVPEESYPLEADEDSQMDARRPWWLKWFGGESSPQCLGSVAFLVKRENGVPNRASKRLCRSVKR